jgi:hypothetical protein
MKNSREWSQCLSILQSQLNNFVILTEKTSNEIVYEFISVQWTDLTLFNELINQTHIRKEVADVLTWTQLQMKRHYDRKHQSLNMKVDDYALLRLHKNYSLSFINILRKKLSQQYADFFKILKKVENLEYRLKFSDNWRIHLMILVTHLESMSNFVSDFYKRSRSKKSEIIYMKENNDNVKSFEVKRLINRRTISREIEYLLRWKDYDSEHDVWRSVSKLQNAKELIHEYEIVMINVINLFDQLSRIISFILNRSSSLTSTASIQSTSSTIVTIISSNNSSQTNLRRSIRKRKSRERD